MEKSLKDTPEKISEFASHQLGRVLLEEGLSNDLKYFINQERRKKNLDVSDHITLEIMAGEIVSWAVYWNKESIMQNVLADAIIINGVDMTTSLSNELTVTNEMTKPEGFTEINVGSKELQFKAFIRVSQ